VWPLIPEAKLASCEVFPHKGKLFEGGGCCEEAEILTVTSSNLEGKK
jgi:hypothetical protein